MGSPPPAASLSSEPQTEVLSEPALRHSPGYRLVAQYLKAILDTLALHYGGRAVAGTLRRKGAGDDPKVDVAVILGGATPECRVVLSLGGESSTMEALLRRGPAREEPPLRILVELVEESLAAQGGRIPEFRRILPTAVKGSQMVQSFLTTGSTVIVPLKTLDGMLTLHISREASSP